MVSDKESLKQELLRIKNSLNLKLDKKLGQCFLIDSNIANYIINQANLNSNTDVVLEIGPGFGVLTKKIAKNVKKLIVIENDPKIATYLKNELSIFDNIEIIIGDALKIGFPKHTKLISNVPYHISGPLLYKIINFRFFPNLIILMLQQEFINKIISSPKPRGYGRLSVASNIFLNIKKLKKINSSVFFPKPRVESGIISLTYKQEIHKIFRDISTKELFFEFLSGIFPYKNKTVKNALSIFFKNLQKNPNIFSKKGVELFNQAIQNLDNKKENNNIFSNKKRLWQLTPNEIVGLYFDLFFK